MTSGSIRILKLFSVDHSVGGDLHCQVVHVCIAKILKLINFVAGGIHSSFN